MNWQSRGDSRRRFKTRKSGRMLPEATTDFMMHPVYEAATEVSKYQLCTILPCLQKQSPIILIGVLHTYGLQDQPWYVWFLTIISTWIFLWLACRTLWKMLHLDSALHKMCALSMPNFQHLPQLSFLCPVKISSNNVLMFTIFFCPSSIEMRYLGNFRRKNPVCDESSWWQTYTSTETLAWKRKQESTTRRFTELSAEIYLTRTNSGPSKTWFSSVRKILSHLAL